MLSSQNSDDSRPLKVATMVMISEDGCLQPAVQPLPSEVEKSVSATASGFFPSKSKLSSENALSKLQEVEWRMSDSLPALADNRAILARRKAKLKQAKSTKSRSTAKLQVRDLNPFLFINNAAVFYCAL